jgi:hypothetical protein
MTWHERWGLVLGASFILWSVSERAFWSMMRSDDTLFFLVLGLLPYIVATYLVFLAIQYFKVSTFFEFVLMGALYGWLVEGVVAMTLFGAPGIPFPITISWTGLAWHMLISVAIMLWWHHRVLTKSLWGSIIFSSCFGLFWGVWSMTWAFETPPIANTVPVFALHVGGITALMAFGHWLLGRRTVTAFTPPRFEWILIGAIAVLYFGGITVQFVGVWAVILPVLFGLLALPLLQSKKRHDAPRVLLVLTTPIPLPNLAMFVLTPAIATAFYALTMSGVIPVFPINMPLFIATSIAGALVLVFAWVLILKGEKAA